jgi:uncharacterized protein YwgA
MENYLLVAGLIEAHPNREVVGRRRLQKTVRLLQRAGLGTDYTFSIYSYGPYSEELHSDITTIQKIGLSSGEFRELQKDSGHIVIRVVAKARNIRIDPFRDFIQKLASTQVTVLEIAATYDVFREMGSDHADALRRLDAKKSAKLSSENIVEALSLLRILGLPAPGYARHAFQ